VAGLALLACLLPLSRFTTPRLGTNGAQTVCMSYHVGAKEQH